MVIEDSAAPVEGCLVAPGSDKSSAQGEQAMEIFVFSYNRGRYLRNCLRSIRALAPDLPVTVIDDASRDPEVLKTLDEYAAEVEVVRADAPKGGHHLGGLYPNMNYAMRMADSEIALFIQDDMQIVRPIESSDLEHVDRFFTYYTHAIELHNAFFKRVQGERNRTDIDVDPAVPVYFRRPDARGSIYFSAVGILHVGRLRRHDFEFSHFESGNDARISAFADRMGITPVPWMMWLPNAETSKFRHKGLLQHYAEWKTDAGFYPYRTLTGTEVERLRQHDLGDVPLAEEWLEPQGMPHKEAWNFADAAKFVPVTRKLLKMRKRFRRKYLGKR